MINLFTYIKNLKAENAQKGEKIKELASYITTLHEELEIDGDTIIRQKKAMGKAVELLSKADANPYVEHAIEVLL